MANLVNWIETAIGDEKIIGCVIGEHNLSWLKKDKYILGVEGKLLSWEEAKPYLNYEFSADYGSISCHPVYVWTDNYVIFISTYDGSTNWNAIPRNPVPCNPYYPGG